MCNLNESVHFKVTDFDSVFTGKDEKKKNLHSNVIQNVFFYAPLHCVSGGVECDMLAALAPPVHLSGERLGWTMLICMVSDFRRGCLEVSWKSALQGHGPSFPTSLALNIKRRGAVAIITVATGDWPSYSCSVHHRRHQKHRRKWHTGPSGRSAADHNGQLSSFCVKCIPD